MAQYGVYPVNENYMKTRTKVGLVIINGGVNQALCNNARISDKPYYKRAQGADSCNFDRCEQGDIVFTMARHQATLHALCRDGSNGGVNHDMNRAHGITRLNGLGNAGDDNIKLMHQIDILGICEHDNAEAPKKLFNIVCGGVMTGLNNGSDTLYVNDWIMAWAPDQSEIPEGGKGKPSDANGDLQLRYKRYDPYTNKITTKAVYKCLASKDKAGYLDTFVQASEALMDGAVKMSLVVMASVFDEMGLPASVKKDAFLKLMFEKCKTAAGSAKLREMLFVIHSESPSNAKWINPTDGKSAMNSYQAEAVDKFILACSYHYHNVIKLVWGRAMNYSRPKTNVDVQIGRYGL